jgi:pyruvate-formate lyase-activating enzyme
MDGTTLDGRIVPLPEVRARLQEGRARGAEWVNLSGGEPTMHPGFVDAVRMARDLGYRKIQTTSNGRMFCYPKYLDEAVRAGLNVITFSIHGHTAELHERHTQAPGSFNQAIAGLKNAVARGGVTADVHAVLTRINVMHAGEMLRFFQRQGASSVQFLQLVPFCAAWENKDALFPSRREGFWRVWEIIDSSPDPQLRPLGPEFLARHAELMTSTIAFPFYESMLRRLLEKGEDPFCRGRRCRYCSLVEFCDDLYALRAGGRLEAKASPPCRREPSARPAAVELGADLGAVLKFFMASRYRVKGRSCAACPDEHGCPGSSLRAVVARGFPSPRRRRR